MLPSSQDFEPDMDEARVLMAQAQYVWSPVLLCSMFSHKTQIHSAFTFFSWRLASHSNEPDRFSRQRFTEATGGRAFCRCDGWPQHQRVHPDPGGADGAGGAEEEEDSAGDLFWSLWFMICEGVDVSVCKTVFLCEQVIYNWTIPLHGQRSDQILLTKTFEMVSRYVKHWTMNSIHCTARPIK